MKWFGTTWNMPASFIVHSDAHGWYVNDGRYAEGPWLIHVLRPSQLVRRKETH